MALEMPPKSIPDRPWKEFSAILDSLTGNHLAWDPQNRQGVVITSDDAQVSGDIEYVVPAPGWEKARATESRLERILSLNAPPHARN